MSVLPLMFCLGAFGILAQVIFMREMLVVSYGNEISIGAILGSWLVGVSLGALAGRVAARGARLRVLLAASLAALAFALPFQVLAIRLARTVLGVPVGECAPLPATLCAALVIFLPTSFGIGFFFPCACRLQSDQKDGVAAWTDDGRGISRVYAFESAGSLVGGVALTFVLLPLLGTVRTIFLASAVGLLGVLLLARSRLGRVAVGIPLAALVTAALLPGVVTPVESLADKVRWESFGVLLKGATSPGAPVPRLVVSRDSVYQNLAVVELEGQYTLYGNGQVMFVFPDLLGDEHRTHFIMAQKPAARKVLLIGGNPAGDIPQLLKYPLDQIVYVEIDPLVGTLARQYAGGALARVSSDPRVRFVAGDGVRFVRTCGEKFDVVLVNAPEPTTAAANRFYTLEFYRSVRAVLARDGFMYASLSVSERLQSEAARLGASVYRTMKEVFPVVLVTAEEQARFFAGTVESDLTFDRKALLGRSRSASLTNSFFRPEYFAGADEIAPDKTEWVAERLSRDDVSLNTSLRPATYFHDLVLWNRYSGSGAGRLLAAAGRLRGRHVVVPLVASGALCLAAGCALRIGRRRLPGGHVERAGAAWSRLMVAVVVAMTGFCGMALEVLLLFVYQNIYGCVYARMGLVVAIFMLGLVTGAVSGDAMARGRLQAWKQLAGIDVLLLCLPLAVPVLMRVGLRPGVAPGTALMLPELLVYGGLLLVGWCVGAEFQIANRLYRRAGGGASAAASVADAADHFGAAAGSVVIGVAFVPVLGIGMSCIVLAAAKVTGLMCLASSVLAAGGGTGAAPCSGPEGAQ